MCFYVPSVSRVDLPGHTPPKASEAPPFLRLPGTPRAGRWGSNPSSNPGGRAGVGNEQSRGSSGSWEAAEVKGAGTATRKQPQLRWDMRERRTRKRVAATQKMVTRKMMQRVTGKTVMKMTMMKKTMIKMTMMQTMGDDDKGDD